MIRTLLLGSILFTIAIYISACGFTPVYSKYESNSTSKTLSNIDIAIIPDREGQFLRNILIDSFYDQGYPVNAKYKLHVNPIQESIRDLDVTITSDTTRGQLTLKSSYTLTNIQTNEVPLTRNIKAITSYNVLGSEFATRITEKNARENAIIDLARQIERAISLFVDKK